MFSLPTFWHPLQFLLVFSLIDFVLLLELIAVSTKRGKIQHVQSTFSTPIIWSKQDVNEGVSESSLTGPAVTVPFNNYVRYAMLQEMNER